MNNRTKKITLSVIALLALSFIGGGFYIVSAEAPLEEPFDEQPLRAFFGLRPGCIVRQLSEEQRTELLNVIKDMREQGSTREEILDYVKEYLEENDIECPRPELTEEQLEALEQLRKDVREYAENRAEELGIELPPMRGPFFHRFGMMARWRRGHCGFNQADN
jgi:hypothetical protein